MPKRRGLFRISIHRSGELRRGADIAPCEVIELTEKGFGLESDLSVTQGEEIELWFIGSSVAEERETMGCGPGWIRSLPAEASEVSRAFGVEDNAFLFE